MRWLERYLTEGTPRLQHFAEMGRASGKAARLTGCCEDRRSDCPVVSCAV
jgi:hypothetical protein